MRAISLTKEQREKAMISDSEGFIHADDFPGIGLLEEGELDSKDRQECSIHGRGSHAAYFVFIQIQKPNFGRITVPSEADSVDKDKEKWF